MKVFWVIAGVFFLVLAVIGLALPVVPQVPFVIAAAFCFMKGSPKLYHAMLRNKTFGPIIRDWQRDGSISRTTKWVTTLSLVVATAISVALKIKEVWLIIEVVCFIAILVWLWTRPEPQHDSSHGSAGTSQYRGSERNGPDHNGPDRNESDNNESDHKGSASAHSHRNDSHGKDEHGSNSRDDHAGGHHSGDE